MDAWRKLQVDRNQLFKGGARLEVRVNVHPNQFSDVERRLAARMLRRGCLSTHETAWSRVLASAALTYEGMATHQLAYRYKGYFVLPRRSGDGITVTENELHEFMEPHIAVCMTRLALDQKQPWDLRVAREFIDACLQKECPYTRLYGCTVLSKHFTNAVQDRIAGEYMKQFFPGTLQAAERALRHLNATQLLIR